MGHQTLSANCRYVVFVGNMSPQISERDLRAMIEAFGDVRNISVMKTPAMDASCGYALVEMSDEIAAARTIAALNGKSIAGRCLKVRLGF